MDVWPLVERWNAARLKAWELRKAGGHTMLDVLDQHAPWTDGTHAWCGTCSGGYYMEALGEWPCRTFLGLEGLLQSKVS